MKNIILILILTTIFFGCYQRQKTEEGENILTQIEIEPRIKFVDDPVNDLLSSIRPPVTEYQIRGDRDTLLTGEKGTLIFIPAGIFQNKDGKTVSGQIIIELIEAVNISDFLLNQLQTVSKDQILQSGGMIFIDATSNEEPLKIKEGHTISIEVQTERKNPKMSLFSGSFVDGKIDWNPTEGMNTDYLISLPFDLLNFNSCSFECGYNEEQINELQQDKYVNSYITTREFEERMCYLSYFSCDHQDQIDDVLLKIYKDNYKGNLSTADSLVLEYMEENLAEFIDTTYNKDEFRWDNKAWISGIYLRYLNYVKQGLTKPLDLTSLGATTPVSRTDLLEKGFSEFETSKIINYIRTRDEVIRIRRDENKTRDLAAYSFSTNNLGWINVDVFFNDPACKESNFIVQTLTNDSFEAIYVSLVIPKRNISIFSIFNEGDTYSFTKKKEGYRLLPINEEAFVVAIAVKDDQSYFGMQEVKIPSTGTVSLNIEMRDKESIAEAIADLSKN
ncbi:MAG: hypothetical protein KDE33_12235 [Bacteroidetes bacterium]|nr:hypothetical protein [Bacteroidota bacterium]